MKILSFFAGLMIDMAKKVKPDIKDHFAQTGSESIDKPLSRQCTVRWICAMKAVIMQRTKDNKDIPKTRAAFAMRVGLTPQNLSSLENEDRNVTLEQVIRICTEFNVSPAWLLIGEGDMWGNFQIAQQFASIKLELELLKDRLGQIEFQMKR